MRLDLFLKTCRLVKRRAAAKELCDNGLVKVNTQEAKAGREVKPGDLITIVFSSRTVLLEVLSVERAAGNKIAAEQPYRKISETRSTLKQDPWKEDR